jgi:SpoVK/Ycf46/Vps4 family AAA+-type ATPase
MDELAKLLASRRDARVAVIGPAEVVSKYIGETKKSLDEGFYSAEEGAAILVFNEGDDLLGRRSEIDGHDGPVVLAVSEVRTIPPELRKGLVVVKAPAQRRWGLPRRRRRRG